MKRALLWAAAAVALIGGVIGTRLLLKRLAFFAVRRVELVGARYLEAAEVTRALRVPPGFSVFDDVGPLARRAEEIPGVVEARVSRRLPGTLRIVVREAEPIALGERGGRLVLLDAFGRVLPFDPTLPAADLPLAEPDSAVAALLSRLRETDPELFGRVQRGLRYRADVALELEAGRVLFRSGASSDEIRDLALVAGVLAKRGQPWRELDARFPPRVIVRRSGV